MEIRYWHAIERLAVEPMAAEIRRELLPELVPGRLLMGHGYIADSLTISLEELLARVWRNVEAKNTNFDEKAEQAAIDYEAQSRRWSLVEHGAMLRSIGLDPVSKDLFLLSARNRFVADNVRLIKSIPRQYLDRVGTQVKDAVTAGVRHETLAKQIEASHGVTANRAKLIARDQISKHQGALNQARQQAAGVDGYIWATAQDERVRPTHRANEGQRFDWSTAPPATGHPGFDIACRCIGIADILRRS